MDGNMGARMSELHLLRQVCDMFVCDLLHIHVWLAYVPLCAAACSTNTGTGFWCPCELSIL